MSKILNTYKNGNVYVSIWDDGTTIREYNGSPEPIYPCSVDVKITNYCLMGCQYCHEMSTAEGQHGDLDKLYSVLSVLPAGVEIAIGGGNPLDHPDLMWFLGELKEQGLIANITINQGHLHKFREVIQYLVENSLVHGVGVSITSRNLSEVKRLSSLTSHLVFHLIAGVSDPKIVKELAEIDNCKILLLGYKLFGFGVDYYTDAVNGNIKKWSAAMPSLIGKVPLSFDNLAISQLNIRRLFTTEGWNEFYMGDDFTFSMYVDGAKQEYAPTSRSRTRIGFNDMTLLEFFARRGTNV